MPGKHRNDWESRAWFYFPDTDLETRVFPLKNICLRTVADASQAPSNYMETSIRIYGIQPLFQAP